MKAKQIRTIQRAVHLVGGLAIATYIYLAPPADSPAHTAIRWLIVPVLVASGVAMWQWPRIRRLARTKERL
ncbi:hypothetical protein ACQP2T_35015 [Nonomuraea sp. CA-143628]|uniref:hypothetical protein n=1 Tax=Nonomuraea sp. CA-143628 TaxID=3239997 RepID=UPI003D91239E